eukprot:SAG11_NODE_2813_length_2945_cov_1.421644_2_plen_175_part_00
MFGVMIEGLPVSTSFAQVEETRFMLTQPVPNGSSLKRLGFFLANVPAPIPDGMVASLYASMYPYAEWRYVGSISNTEPSKVLNIVWKDADTQDQPPEAPCQLGVTIEAAAAVAAVDERQISLQEEFGKKVGLDLFTFMESFNHGVGTSIFEKWYEKLQFKLRHAPEWKRFRPSS